MKAGRTAMTIHHIGSANELVAALGDAITAMPVPRGPDRRRLGRFGDGSNAVFAAIQESRGGVEMDFIPVHRAATTSPSTSWQAR